MKDMLAKAKLNNYAVPATNIDNEHNLRAAIQAAEEMNSPLILNVTPVANPDIEYFGRIATDLIRRSPCEIVLNLDHGKTFDQCMKGIQAGFTNIMIDRSTLPFEQNVKETAEMVKIAHALGCTVEAELGHVGFGNQYEVDGYSGLTQVREAKEFVERWARENGPFGIEKVIQGTKTESVPLGELKKLSEERMLLFDEKLMTFAMGNCIVMEDTNGNRKLLKKRHDAKIDAVASMMDAFVAFKLNREAFE